MDTKVSFILPCYNVAPYVRRCLESIENQDIERCEYEIICVDDCSTDSTIDTIKECQAKYDNIILHCHEFNKNAGGARNTGIDKAKGDYIWFVDPDDSIMPNVLSRVYSIADERNSEMLLFNLQLTTEQGILKCSSQYQDIDRCISGIDFVSEYCGKLGLYEVASHVSCLFRRSFLINNHIYYPQIRSSQDVVFIWNAVLSVSRMSSIPDVCYHVFRRPLSTTGSKGKLSPEAIISASALYSVELIKLVDRFHDTVPKSVINTLLYEVKLSVNNDSRTVLKLRSKDLFAFYNKLTSYSGQVDCVSGFMNRKTKFIFNYKIPFCLWVMGIYGYKWYGRLFSSNS